MFHHCVCFTTVQPDPFCAATNQFLPDISTQHLGLFLHEVFSYDETDEWLTPAVAVSLSYMNWLIVNCVLCPFIIYLHRVYIPSNSYLYHHTNVNYASTKLLRPSIIVSKDHDDRKKFKVGIDPTLLTIDFKSRISLDIA